ncbi:hydrogenase nickel incorporation protein HypB [Prosthecochloris sp. N3]|uniref:Hydrogenase nickel incorporation protein HypB n=1 Tax=Prosthecochloris ethylica TaxID=2743976 RepID=A0ABR9XTC2_9CHLB|nr:MULTISPECIES: hydrogenase nickel incorporation protein HypB [Prosthecochloris]MEC9486066.1 hydrogenase nickel incorporation protein HypB [Prosthecochloris sp.]MBF0587173.1 hydrogenase nickel incorporation protein HypB [Prosthecochloris ethylica]MBF0637251.1 hydrogenase nickel incorporation protein HypB [Prosthecochloris ethylica]NUK48442.1 hydrogenase nickel incorporation protein HypB [Prosthecochloris ethylica]RNA68158.1 hydrogenase accessory protein HypB [Prosthecochloris sp. ZM_2]
MCDTCGCSSDGGAVLCKPGDANWHVHVDDGGHVHDHGHGHDHGHHHEPAAGQGRQVRMEQDVLMQNNLLAERNRGYFEARGILALNFLSSPGSGKTSLLEKMIPLLREVRPVSVIEGDQQTMQDAERIDALGVPVVQVNTGTGCHLDAAMINRAVREMDVASGSLLCIENVGNLVCPALFDLGEALKVVIISTTEGDDKPLKYPTMFHEADVCILNKIDLLPYVPFDAAACREHAMRVNHHLEWFELSAATGEGVEEWMEWLKRRLEQV